MTLGLEPSALGPWAQRQDGLTRACGGHPCAATSDANRRSFVIPYQRPSHLAAVEALHEVSQHVSLQHLARRRSQAGAYIAACHGRTGLICSSAGYLACCKGGLATELRLRTTTARNCVTQASAQLEAPF